MSNGFQSLLLPANWGYLFHGLGHLFWATEFLSCTLWLRESIGNGVKEENMSEKISSFLNNLDGTKKTQVPYPRSQESKLHINISLRSTKMCLCIYIFGLSGGSPCLPHFFHASALWPDSCGGGRGSRPGFVAQSLSVQSSLSGSLSRQQSGPRHTSSVCQAGTIPARYQAEHRTTVLTWELVFLPAFTRTWHNGVHCLTVDFEAGLLGRCCLALCEYQWFLVACHCVLCQNYLGLSRWQNFWLYTRQPLERLLFNSMHLCPHTD